MANKKTGFFNSLYLPTENRRAVRMGGWAAAIGLIVGAGLGYYEEAQPRTISPTLRQASAELLQNANRLRANEADPWKIDLSYVTAQLAPNCLSVDQAPAILRVQGDKVEDVRGSASAAKVAECFQQRAEDLVTTQTHPIRYAIAGGASGIGLGFVAGVMSGAVRYMLIPEYLANRRRRRQKLSSRIGTARPL